MRKQEAFTKTRIHRKSDDNIGFLVWVYDVNFCTLWMSSYQLIKAYWQFSVPCIFGAVVVNVSVDFTMISAPHSQMYSLFLFLFQKFCTRQKTNPVLWHILFQSTTYWVFYEIGYVNDKFLTVLHRGLRNGAVCGGVLKWTPLYSVY